MEGYKDLFEKAGFSRKQDLENLKSVSEGDLEAMGIKRRGLLLSIACACVQTKLKTY